MEGRVALIAPQKTRPGPSASLRAGCGAVAPLGPSFAQRTRSLGMTLFPGGASFRMTSRCWRMRRGPWARFLGRGLRHRWFLSATAWEGRVKGVGQECPTYTSKIKISTSRKGSEKWGTRPGLAYSELRPLEFVLPSLHQAD